MTEAHDTLLLFQLLERYQAELEQHLPAAAIGRATFREDLLDAARSLCRSRRQDPAARPCSCGGYVHFHAICDSDPTPPRCGGCRHALSHGFCPQCEPGQFALATRPSEERAHG